MSQLEDSERLKLLKEVGGASLYEDKRAESYKTMMTQREHAATINESVRPRGSTVRLSEPAVIRTVASCCLYFCVPGIECFLGNCLVMLWVL